MTAPQRSRPARRPSLYIVTTDYYDDLATTPRRQRLPSGERVAECVVWVFLALWALYVAAQVVRGVLQARGVL